MPAVSGSSAIFAADLSGDPIAFCDRGARAVARRLRWRRTAASGRSLQGRYGASPPTTSSTGRTRSGRGPRARTGTCRIGRGSRVRRRSPMPAGCRAPGRDRRRTPRRPRRTQRPHASELPHRMRRRTGVDLDARKQSDRQRRVAERLAHRAERSRAERRHRRHPHGVLEGLLEQRGHRTGPCEQRRVGQRRRGRGGVRATTAPSGDRRRVREVRPPTSPNAIDSPSLASCSAETCQGCSSYGGTSSRSSKNALSIISGEAPGIRAPRMRVIVSGL